MPPLPARKAITHNIDVDVLAPRHARNLVADAVGEHPRLDDILLATSELVTNVVRHGRGITRAELRLERRDGSVRVGIRQHGTTFGQHGTTFERVQHRPTDPDGRGLTIVEAVTDRWGVESDDGLLVWFEVAG